ncbi:MAG: hypothetical protein EA409_13520 [Saprospirales bacterium]|nr:MAG: hypothetical protein EA409_13520 [Saprospirales bacterium]
MSPHQKPITIPNGCKIPYLRYRGNSFLNLAMLRQNSAAMAMPAEYFTRCLDLDFASPPAVAVLSLEGPPECQPARFSVPSLECPPECQPVRFAVLSLEGPLDLHPMGSFVHSSRSVSHPSGSFVHSHDDRFFGVDSSILNWIFRLLLFFSACSFICCDSSNNVESFKQIQSSIGKNIYPYHIGNLVLISSQYGGKNCLKAVDLTSFEILWKMMDPENLINSQYTNFTPYSYDSTTVLPMVNSICVINHYTGIVSDSLKFNGIIAPNMFGHKDVVFPIETLSSPNRLIIHSYNLCSNQLDTVLLIPFSEDKLVAKMGPFLDGDNKDSYFSSFLSYNKSTNQTKNNLIFWNKDYGVVDTLSLSADNLKGFGVTRPPVEFYESGLYLWHLTDALVAYDSKKREIVWHKSLGEVMISSRPLIFQNRIIYPTESNMFLIIDEQNLMPIDTVKKTPFLPGRLIESKDEVFFISGLDGKIYKLSYHQDENNFTIDMYSPDLTEFPFFYQQFFVDDDVWVLNDGEKWILARRCHLFR